MSICGGRGLERALSVFLLFRVACSNHYHRLRVDIIMNPGREQNGSKEDKENTPQVQTHAYMNPVSPNTANLVNLLVVRLKSENERVGNEEYGKDERQKAQTQTIHFDRERGRCGRRMEAADKQSA